MSTEPVRPSTESETEAAADRGDAATQESARPGDVRPEATDNGGRMTNSPPSNVMNGKDQSCEVLLSGTDSLYLNFDLHWGSTAFFEELERDKRIAAKFRNDMPFIWRGKNPEEEWKFVLKGYGLEGYAWFLTNNDYEIKIGNWTSPQSRPSAYVKVLAEAVWRKTPIGAFEELARMFQGVGVTGLVCKPSRVDLCVDVLLSDSVWNSRLLDNLVTRAKKRALYFDGNKFTGLSIGRGKVSARIYDKPEEIREKSGKTWFYDLWEINEVPPQKVVVRVEFQVRREALLDLGIRDMNDLILYEGNLWAYLTQKWMKFQDRPDAHYSQRTIETWWENVCSNFKPRIHAHPLIRGKAIQSDMRGRVSQLIGSLTSLAALQEDPSIQNDLTSIDEYPVQLQRLFGANRIQDSDLADKVVEKVCKNFRSIEKFNNVQTERRRLGLPGGGEA